MPTEETRPLVIPSLVDPEVECVRIDAEAPSGELAQPPGPAAPGGEATAGPCPEGYVPRRKRGDYVLRGKEVVTERPPIRNPDDPGDE